jgi:hypothetical protein
MFLSVRMSLLTLFDQNMMQGFLVEVNGALVGKRLEAVRSSSTRRSCMVSALSSFVFVRGHLLLFRMGGACGLGS